MDGALDIANVTGERLQSLRERENSAGQHQITLDLRNVISGTYFISLRACGLSQTIPVQVIR